jgi:signal transduction histidine kinase
MSRNSASGRAGVGRVGLAFVAALTSFVAVAVIVKWIDSSGILVALGLIWTVGVAMIARRWGVEYAVPIASAALLAGDWYAVKPTHELGIPDAANLTELFVFISVSVLIGQIAALAGRRAEISEEARSELASEQAALRRVATLVAEGGEQNELFAAVVGEAGTLLGTDLAGMVRYGEGNTLTAVANWAADGNHPPIGQELPHEGKAAAMATTGEGARENDWREVPGGLSRILQELGIRSSVGVPIVVGGVVWGGLVVHSRRPGGLPAETESRLTNFTELVSTAISNADSRSQLTASRARLVTEGDEARRRVVRDLHDGAQQRLVHAIVTLKLAKRAFRADDGEAESLVGEALEQAEQGNAELRELAHGILPSALTRGGLRAGLDAVVERIDLPIQASVPEVRFAPEIEASAYFVVAEALTNVVKHSHASSAEIAVLAEDGMLRVEVRDDGEGGADPAGHGLLGMRDRVTAIGGYLEVNSPHEGGTIVVATLPLSGVKERRSPARPRPAPTTPSTRSRR